MGTRDLLQAPVEQSVERHGAHLVDLVVRGDKGKQVLEVFIDNEQGVTSDLCAEISRDLIDTIDRSGALQSSYRLDVSSPGVDRPLRFSWQFKKHVGRDIEVFMSPDTGSKRLVGKFMACEDGQILLRQGSGKPDVTIPLQQIAEIRVRVPW